MTTHPEHHTLTLVVLAWSSKAVRSPMARLSTAASAPCPFSPFPAHTAHHRHEAEALALGSRTCRVAKVPLVCCVSGCREDNGGDSGGPVTRTTLTYESRYLEGHETNAANAYDEAARTTLMHIMFITMRRLVSDDEKGPHLPGPRVGSARPRPTCIEASLWPRGPSPRPPSPPQRPVGARAGPRTGSESGAGAGKLQGGRLPLATGLRQRKVQGILVRARKPSLVTHGLILGEAPRNLLRDHS
jgi:hypothetical protein